MNNTTELLLEYIKTANEASLNNLRSTELCNPAYHDVKCKFIEERRQCDERYSKLLKKLEYLRECLSSEIDVSSLYDLKW